MNHFQVQRVDVDGRGHLDTQPQRRKRRRRRQEGCGRPALVGTQLRDPPGYVREPVAHPL